MEADSDSDSGGEAIVICIDHTTNKEYLDAQFEAVRSYATYKIQSHPRTVVGLLTCTPEVFRYRFYVRPTRNLDKLFRRLTSIKRGCSFDVSGAISSSFVLLITANNTQGLKRRLVLFAGGYIFMDLETAAERIRLHGLAVDVVNFDDEWGYRKEKLEALVHAVHDDDAKSHIIHVKEGSSLNNLLSSFMLRDAQVEADRMKNKDHQLIEKAIENENVDVKQPSSSVMAKGMKNENELNRLKKTTRPSRQKK